MRINSKLFASLASTATKMAEKLNEVATSMETQVSAKAEPAKRGRKAAAEVVETSKVKPAAKAKAQTKAEPAKRGRKAAAEVVETSKVKPAAKAKAETKATPAPAKRKSAAFVDIPGLD